MTTAIQQPTATRETAKILCELIVSQMNLRTTDVSIYNQKRDLTKKKGIWVDVAIIGETTVASTTRPVNDPLQTDLTEVQTISQQEILQIDIMSADDSARMRRKEVIFALSGTAAQQAAETYSLKISNIPQSFVDVSEVEASARLNRYAITVTVLRAYSIVRTIPTFTVFQNPPQKLLVNP